MILLIIANIFGLLTLGFVISCNWYKNYLIACILGGITCILWIIAGGYLVAGIWALNTIIGYYNYTFNK